MSKRTKKVKARLKEIKDIHGRPMAILTIGKKTIGEILKTGKQLEARSNKGKIFHVNGIDEGLKDLLSEYHLHHK